MNSIFGKIVVMIICAGMALWGADQAWTAVNSGLGSNLAGAGARGIDAQTLDRRVENLLRNINANADKPITKSEAADQGIVDQVFELEKSKIVNLGYANAIGVKPSTDAVVEQLKTVDAFKNPLTGELDLNTYREVLYQNRFTKEEYEQQVSDDLTLKTMSEGATAALFPPQVLAGIQALYIGETRDVTWFILDASKAPTPEAPTDDDIRAYYDANLESLEQPERRSINLLQMSADDFLSQVTVTEQEIATIYEATKSERFSEPDQRTYIELYFADRDTARTAFGLLAGGADPATLPGVLSSETKTGDKESIADTALQDAMFGPGKQSGALFGPREVEGRWQVARLVSVQPGAVYPIETVSEVIRGELARERAQVLFYEKLDALDRAIGAGYPLAQIASEVGVPILSFEPVDANGLTESGILMNGLIAAQDAFQGAFQIGAGDVSNRFDGEEAVYLTSPDTIIAPSTPEFDTIKEDIRQLLVQQRAATAMKTYSDDVVAKVKSGETTLVDAAAAADSVLESPPMPLTRVTAEQSGLPSPAITDIFSGSEGDVYAYPNRAGDKYMVVRLDKITPPSDEALAVLGTRATSSLNQALNEDLQVALQAEIQKAIKLKTSPGALAAYKKSIATEQ
ncbi:MAG: peptidyl-prolyl cis-trans isomerase [Alphaproteobacteria bacterium]|nr:peptidyl-prolyl cis-trans isomerase [Alphaproteobacteria bacterium]MBU2141884.1 peptidyl-prolyl cis-trans isomerase [Alphaproteobacteria bacterium]MBU2195744.1 peptidyl-prolyl cis-trans isomerase [Alphaproteobacteria bacterium]